MKDKAGIDTDEAIEVIDNTLAGPSFSKEDAKQYVTSRLIVIWERQEKEIAERKALEQRELERVLKEMEQALAVRDHKLHERLEKEAKLIKDNLQVLTNREREVKQVIINNMVQIHQQQAFVQTNQFMLVGAVSIGTISMLFLLSRSRGKKKRRRDETPQT